METVSDGVGIRLQAWFTFHTGQMETPTPSDSPPPPSERSHSTQVRWRPPCPRMSMYVHLVHIPHRSDGDYGFLCMDECPCRVHIPHRSDGDLQVHCSYQFVDVVHIPHRSDGDLLEIYSRNTAILSSHSTQVRWRLLKIIICLSIS